MSGILGLVPARAGSVGVRGKNIRPLGGRPLIVHTIEAARASRLDRVVISTDSEEIAAIGAAAGAERPFLRPAELASSHRARHRRRAPRSGILPAPRKLDAGCRVLSAAHFAVPLGRRHRRRARSPRRRCGGELGDVGVPGQRAPGLRMGRGRRPTETRLSAPACARNAGRI